MIPSASNFVLALIAPVQWIVDLLHPVLLFFHDSVGVGWGTSIVLLTVCVRALLAPLTVKQFKSMQAMVRVAPQLKELQAKYKNDKARQQQEVMKFYAENKVNPFASCLPLIAQMPFFIGLFYLLQSDLRVDICGEVAREAPKNVPCAEIAGAMTGTEDFLFIPDLTTTATGWVLALLIMMYITSQLLSSVLTPSTGDRNQRLLLYALPFVFVLFVINFPTGLIVYWITTNLWTVGQGYILRKRMGPITMPKGEPAVAASTAGGGRGGGFMARLAAATSASNENAAATDAKPGRANSAAAKDGKERTPATTGAKAGGRSRPGKAATAKAEPVPKPTREGPPPPPPRKKKKRSGRRR